MKDKGKKRQILLDYGYSGTGDSASSAEIRHLFHFLSFLQALYSKTTKNSFLFRKNQANDIIQ